MTLTNSVLKERRISLLKVISATDLNQMHRRVSGRSTIAMSGTFLRNVILRHWDDYADEIRQWCEFAITGESVL